MSLKIYVLTCFISILLSLVASMYDIKITFGILLSSVFSLINMFILSKSMEMMIKSNGSNQSILMIGNMIRFTLLIVVVFIAIKNQQIFSIIGVAIGFTLFMVALIIDAISKRKG